MDLVDLAAQLRDRGASLAEHHADMVSPLWSERAYKALLRVARRQEKLFADDVRAELNEAPASPNAFGAVWLKAIRDGVVTRTHETIHSREPRRHKHRYFLYRSNLYRRAS